MIYTFSGVETLSVGIFEFKQRHFWLLNVLVGLRILVDVFSTQLYKKCVILSIFFYDLAENRL